MLIVAIFVINWFISIIENIIFPQLLPVEYNNQQVLNKIIYLFCGLKLCGCWNNHNIINVAYKTVKRGEKVCLPRRSVLHINMKKIPYMGR